MVEGFATEKISSVDFCLEKAEVVGVRFLDLYLKENYKTIRCAMYSGRQSVYLRTRFDG
jgi:hypothetical protein